VEKILLSPFSLLPFSFSLSLASFVPTECFTVVTVPLQLYFYTIMLTNAKEHRSGKVKSLSFGCFLILFFIDSTIFNNTCVYFCVVWTDAYLRVLFPFLFVQLLFSVVCWYRCF